MRLFSLMYEYDVILVAIQTLASILTQLNREHKKEPFLSLIALLLSDMIV